MNELTKRKGLFDTAWVLTIVLVCVSVLVPWLVGLEGSTALTLALLAGLAISQLLLSAAAPQVTTTRALTAIAFAQQLLGLTVLGVVWHLQGGLQHPMFLAFLLVPVLAGSLVLTVWQQQVAVFFTIVLAGSAVLLAPDLRAVVAQQLGAAWVPSPPAGWPPDPTLFPDLRVPPAYDLSLLGTFVFAAVTFSAVSGAASGLIARLTARAQAKEEEAARTQRVLETMVEAAPTAEVVVAAATGRIVRASAEFRATFGLSGDLAGEFLLDALPFRYPEVIRRLLDRGGEARQTITVGDRAMPVRLRSAIVLEAPERLVLLQLEPDSGLSVKGALDGLSDAVVVLELNHAISYMNERAVALFGDAHRTQHASALSTASGATPKWWDLGPLATARRELVLAGNNYVATLRRQRGSEGTEDVIVVHVREAASGPP